jgi:phosphoglycolate phosphatase
MQLVLFDCDGTLVDSQNIIHAAMSAAFEAAGLEPPCRQRALSIVGLSLMEAVSRLLPEVGGRTLTAVADGYKHHAQALRSDPAFSEPFFPGARETVLWLARRPDVVLGVATGKSRRGVDRLIDESGLEGVFTIIQTADSAPSKPHPAMIEQAMREAGVGPERTTMIGDTTYDIDMARNAGVTGIGVAWGYHPVEALRQSGAHHIIESFGELEPLLQPTAEAGTS